MAGVLIDHGAFHRLVAEETSATKPFENEAGWAWVVEPIEKHDNDANMYFGSVNKGPDDAPPPSDATPESVNWDRLIALMEEGKDRELVISFVRPAMVFGYHRTRPIAVDRDGNRHELKAVMAAASKGIMLERWTSDAVTLPASKVAFLGLEGLTTEGVKMEIDAARERAGQKGLAVLPIPAVGQPYPFALTDISGSAIESESLRGKVVLLDFWASWCFPCMEKMPKLKALYDSYHGDGLEVIGVNLDASDEARDKAIQELGLSWHQSVPPGEEDDRDLWTQAMGLRSIPRLLLIDRAGILRADCAPNELEAELKALIESRK
jgi:thiol-disulfide isomerase/thioredoxin